MYKIYMVTQTKFHNQSDCRQHYWFITACACAIPVLLQLSESSSEGLKCMVYSLPMNILQPCHPCPFWLISIIHYSFTRPLFCIFMICAWHTKPVSSIKACTNLENDTIKLSVCGRFSTVLHFSQNETTGSGIIMGPLHQSWTAMLKHVLKLPSGAAVVFLQ